MFDFIAVESYYPVYINFALVLTLFTLLHSRTVSLNNAKNLSFTHIAGLSLLLFLILFIGLRPVHPLFGDTVNYMVTYNNYKIGGPILTGEDPGWHLFMRTLAPYMSIHAFFTITSFLYIFPMYRLSKELTGIYWYYAFIMFIVSFSFWTYGVNGVRNGVACSLFLWGLSYRHSKGIMIFFFLLAALFHKTTLLPIFAFALTYFYNEPKLYFKAWLACIPLSLLFGGAWIALFTSIGFGDDRLSGYLSIQGDQSLFSGVGFRWDFLFHSAFAVFAGWYFVFRRKFNDKFYFQLLNTYLICNGFWILVIQANYSNRFAYLSWFMMAIVIIYPLLKENFFKNQHKVIANVVALYFSFTYLMFYVYYN